MTKGILCLLVLMSTAVLADEPRAPALPAPEGVPATVFSFGKENPDCVEWTNACQICTRSSAGEMQCSTPGIACTPGVPICRVRKTP